MRHRTHVSGPLVAALLVVLVGGCDQGRLPTPAPATSVPSTAGGGVTVPVGDAPAVDGTEVAGAGVGNLP